MNKKIIVATVLIFVFSIVVIATYNNAFTNGLTTENINLTTNSEITRYIKLPIYSNVNYVGVNLTDIFIKYNTSIHTNSTIFNYAQSVKYYNGLLYVCAKTSNSLVVLNVSNINQFEVVRSYINSTANYGFKDFYVDGEYIYTITEDGANTKWLIFNQTNNNIVLLKEIQNVAWLTNGIAIDYYSNYSYVISQASASIIIYNVTDKLNAKNITRLVDTTYFSGVYDLEVNNNLIYTASAQMGIWNITNKSIITLVANYTLTSGAYGAKLQDELLYVHSEEEIIVFNISQNNFTKIANFTNSTSIDHTGSFSVKNKIVYISNPNEFTIINFTNITNPKQILHKTGYTFATPKYMDIDSFYAYISDRDSDSIIKVKINDSQYDFYISNYKTNSTITDLKDVKLDFTNNITDIIEDGCICENCVLDSSNNCTIPVSLISKTPGILQVSNINITYDPTVYINITVYDESTGNRITSNGTIKVYNNADYGAEYNYNFSQIVQIPFDNVGEYYFYIATPDYQNRIYTVTLGSTNTQLLNAYLIPNVTSYTVFSVTDKETSKYLENVLMTQYRQINGTWQAVESKYTDPTGRALFYYQSSTRYKFFLSKTGYSDYVTYYPEILFSSYDLQMNPTTIGNTTGDYDNIGIIYAPTIFYNNRENNFSIIFQSPYGELTSYGYVIIYPGGMVSNSGSNALGGQLTSNFTIINADLLDRVNINYFYTTEAAGTRNFNEYFIITNISLNSQNYNFTMISNRDKTYGLGLFERALVATLIALFTIGIAALMGRVVAGVALASFIWGYLIIIGFLPFWLVAIPITIALIMLAMGNN